MKISFGRGWLAAVLLLPAVALADPTETDRLLGEATSPLDLRSRLTAHAHSVESSYPAEAGAALYYTGLSLERSGQRDSAIFCYRSAIALRREAEERVALADALLARRAPGDIAEALQTLRDPSWDPAAFGETVPYEVQARVAWGQVLAGHPDSAITIFNPIEPRLTLRPLWRFRVARAALEAGDPRKAYMLLLTLAIQSRKQDQDVMAKMREAASQLGVETKMDKQIDQLLSERDRIEQTTVARMDGRRIRLSGTDGFPLAALLLRPNQTSRPRAAVIYVAPGDTLADYDSLGTTLTRAGYAVAFLDLRGSGGSVAPACPLPDTWGGREEPLQLLSARDLGPALRALAEATGADTSRCLVGGVGTAAVVALHAAELDRRAKAALLVSPRAGRVEHGPLRARVARLQIPIYFQIGPEDLVRSNLTENLYQAGNRGSSRVSETRTVGQGVRQFGYDPAVTQRLMRWLGELRRPSPRRASPPPGRRQG